MNITDLDSDELTDLLRTGDRDALAEIFSRLHERLKKVIQFRLDYRLRGRISESDVLQDAYIAALKRIEHFMEKDSMPMFVWLRLLVNQQLVDVHRQHITAEIRDARKEVAIEEPLYSGQTSVALAAHIVGQLTSPSRAFERAERIALLNQSLNRMAPLDREVIALRHLEELTPAETAEVLQIDRSAASKRYVRALRKLRELLTNDHARNSRELD